MFVIHFLVLHVIVQKEPKSFVSILALLVRSAYEPCETIHYDNKDNLSVCLFLTTF